MLSLIVIQKCYIVEEKWRHGKSVKQAKTYEQWCRRRWCRGCKCTPKSLICWKCGQNPWKSTCCDRKSQTACAQSFALWQQAAIEITRRDHSPRTLAITFNRSHANSGRASTPWSLHYCLFAPLICSVFLHTYPVRGESHNQRNANGEVATHISEYK